MPSHLKYIAFAVPLLVTACGEGYEPTRIQGIVPYVMERTAGTGVAYVRAKMMPAKEIVVETKTEAPIAAPPPAPLKSAEPVFHEQMKK